MTRVNTPFLSSGVVMWAAFCLFGALVFARKILEFPFGSDGWWAGWVGIAMSIAACLSIDIIWSWFERQLDFDAEGVTIRRWLGIPFGRPGTRVSFAEISRAQFSFEVNRGRFLDLWTDERRRFRMRTDLLRLSQRQAIVNAFNERGVDLSPEYVIRG